MAPRHRTNTRPGAMQQAREELRHLLLVLQEERKIYERRLRHLEEELAWVRRRQAELARETALNHDTEAKTDA